MPSKHVMYLFAWVCNVDIDPEALIQTQLWYPSVQISLSMQIKPLQRTGAMCNCMNLKLQCLSCGMEPADPSLASNGSMLICNLECNSSRTNLGKTWKGMKKFQEEEADWGVCHHTEEECYARKRKSSCMDFPKLARSACVLTDNSLVTWLHTKLCDSQVEAMSSGVKPHTTDAVTSVWMLSHSQWAAVLQVHSGIILYEAT